MITKIKIIENLGIFSNYARNSDLADFKKFNLFYGWTGSGKTTLSKLFSAFESGKLKEYPELKYCITDNGRNLKENEPYSKKIRVFNEDYITNNINVVESHAKPIYILGEENKELLKIIKEDESMLKEKLEKLEEKRKLKTDEGKNKDSQFTTVARIIGEEIIGISSRKYTKPDAKQDFEELKEKKLLTEENKEECLLTLKQQEKENIFLIKNTTSETINAIIQKSESLLIETVETIIIDRLKNNADISQWVENGITLHREKQSVNCEFCDQPLPRNRIPELLTYFNKADGELKTKIGDLSETIDQSINSISSLDIPDKARLYKEYQNQYSENIETITEKKTKLLEELKDLKNKINNKRQHTAQSIKLDILIDDKSFVSTINKANDLIGEHNRKTEQFNTNQKNAKQELKNHYLSTIYDEVNCLKTNIQTLSNEIDILEDGDSNNDGITVINDRIKKNKSEIAPSDRACLEINKQLEIFLGRDELAFAVSDEGYVIKRKGDLAKHLSKGEKTAISFVYFTIHLNDQNFDIKSGIVVIDDPISSLDSNSLFQAFSFLKNSVKEAYQAFIFTHNFEFLKLILGWLNHENKQYREYYMIKNPIDDNNRIVELSALDNLLTDYGSEYQYLFKLIYEFKSDGTISSVYHIPNIGRKLLECFLMFVCPNNDSMYKKLQLINFDENKKIAIDAFVNKQSHIRNGFDPSIVAECQNNIKHLLEMIEFISPDHYKILKETINNNQ